MIIRQLEKKLLAVSKKYPVVLLTGPRQSGKTTLSKKAFPGKPYISFEDPDNRQYAKDDPRGLLERYPDGAIFDEVQRSPELLSYLQGVVDVKKKSGMFILTGSQNILLLKSVQQSLAGRVAILRLLPFSLAEISRTRKNIAIDDLIYTGGFPRIYDKKLDPTEAMRNYIESYLERDVRQILNVKSLSTFQRFMKLCAGRTGQVLNLSSLGSDAGVSHTTAGEWMSILEASYIVLTLPPYYRNFNKRLIKSPKLYFTDTGLACCLLGINNPSHVSRDPLLGGLFENYVITEVFKHYCNQGQNAPLYYFRDNVGNEIDLIIESGRKVFGVEIKAGRTIGSDWFGTLKYFLNVMGSEAIGRGIVYGGKESMVRDDTIICSYNNMEKIYSRLQDL